MDEEREDNRRNPVMTKDELHAKYDVQSESPGFEGATPQALARAVFRPVKKRSLKAGTQRRANND